MEVKEGYKQTEVCVIPEDWDVKKLGEIADIRSGGTPSTNQQQFWDGDVFWCTPTDITALNGHKYLRDTSRKITQIGLKNSSAEMIPANSIVMTPRATIGECAINTVPVSTNQGFKNLVPFDYVDAEFLYYLLLTQKRGFIGLCAGSTFLEIGKVQLNAFEIQLPITKAEQTAIAAVHSDIDALIQSLEKLIANKRRIKKGGMQGLLKLQEGRGVRKLGGVADSTVRWSFTGGPFGSNLKSSDYTYGGVRIIQLQNIGDGDFINDYEVYTSEIKANELISCNIYPRDIILSKMGDPVARACIIPDFHKRYLMCSDGIRLAVDTKNYNTYFIYIYINSPQFRILAENASTGSTRKRIGLKELRKLEFCCPNLSEQTRIAAILSDMDAEIAALETKLAKYKQIKQGMMQELLTGRIRLI